MSELYPLLFDMLPQFKYIAGFLMFNFDLIYLRGSELKEDRPSNFDTLIRKIRE